MSEILVLGHDDVVALLDVASCVPLMRDTLAALAGGDGFQPLRAVYRPPVPGLSVLMPAYAGGAAPALGVKVLGVFPDNPARGLDAHQGMVLLQDPETGAARAIMSASAITAVRTAAVSAVATDALAAPAASTLAILGTGVQAVWHARALTTVRPLAHIRLVGRDAARGSAVAASLAAEFSLDVSFGTDAAAAVAGAEVVVTATNSHTPVLRHEWLAPGAHVNAVGASVPSARELDAATVAAARVFVDSREGARTESGDLLRAYEETGLDESHVVATLGEVLAGLAPGRLGDELTLFKSLGLAIEDVAAARHLYAAALAAGRGTRVAF